jgi:hypothetical protein
MLYLLNKPAMDLEAYSALPATPFRGGKEPVCKVFHCDCEEIGEFSPLQT